MRQFLGNRDGIKLDMGLSEAKKGWDHWWGAYSCTKLDTPMIHWGHPFLMGVLGFGGTKVYKLANRAPLEYLLELRQKYGLFAFYLPTIC